MKSKLLNLAVVTLVSFASVRAASAAVVASDTFTATKNLNSYSAIDAEGNDPTNSGVWSSGFDNFGPRSTQDHPGPGPTGNFLSDAVVDTSVADGVDTLGIVTPSYPGKFFAIVDTDNGANPSGVVTGTWKFDISQAANLSSFEVDMGAVGSFYDDGSAFERFVWAYSIDGSLETELLTIRADASLGAVDYTLANGSITTVPGNTVAGPDDNGVSVNGVALLNNLTTLSAPLSGTGNELTLTLWGFVNGNNAALVADNIRINGSLVPEPASALMALTAGMALLPLRRNRR